MKIKNNQLDKVEELSPFQKIKQRAKRHEQKINKATEQLVENQTAQIEELSSRLRLMMKLYRAAVKMLPESLRDKWETARAEIEGLENIDSDNV